MKKYIFNLIVLITLGLVSCNQPKTDSNPVPNTTESSTANKPATKSIKAKPGDNVTANPGDKILLETPTSVQNTHDLPNSFFNKKWMRSPSEDDRYKGEVYRPEGFKTLIAMRFTPTFSFKKNKTCEYLKLMPNDAHEMQSASWAYNTSKKFRIFTNGENGRLMLNDWTIVNTKGNLLVVKSNDNSQR